MTTPRVGFRGMLAVLAVVLAVWWLIPRLADRWEPANFAVHYRTPASFSQDYWQYRRFARQAAAADEILLVGDSVVWGEYVDAGQTLADHLTQASGRGAVFRNGGLNGLHPLAMEGLCRTYLGSPLPRRILLHCNPLWLTSPERDLQVAEPVFFNHSDLVPQFTPQIPAYGAGLADRLSVTVERIWTWRQWVRHYRERHLDGQDLPQWSLEHPYEWPRSPNDAQLSFEKSRQKSLPWTKRGIRPQEYPWVPLESSLQWRAFQQLVGWLRDRDVRVLVVIGPFNTHLLNAAGQHAHEDRVRAIEGWLRGQPGVHVVTAALLPSEQYADASHPLAAGYRSLAEQLVKDEAFAAFLQPDVAIETVAEGQAGHRANE